MLFRSGLGVSALGMNCSLGPVQMNEMIDELTSYSSTPIIIQPNAGLPIERDGKTTFDIDSDGFANEVKKMAEKGVAILGGCCGTTPEYIRKIKEITKDIPYSYIEKKSRTLVSSYTHSVEIGNSPILIGERINPTGKPKIKEALRSGDMSYILSEAIGQEERGAHILDVNVGLPGINEKEMLSRATGRTPVFIGKPEPTMALLAMEKTGFSKEETAIRGDRLYTDIACGVNAGLSSIFVLSGEGTMADVENSNVKPDFIYENIKEIYKELECKVVFNRN